LRREISAPSSEFTCIIPDGSKTIPSPAACAPPGQIPPVLLAVCPRRTRSTVTNAFGAWEAILSSAATRSHGSMN
jgi:hypothetical protein